MAWGWSHTQEAYDNVKTNLDSLPDEVLHIIFAEWAAAINTEEGHTPDFDRSLYDAGVELAKEMHHHTLLEKVWQEVEALATCDNGGFEAWVCPYGCHTLPFDLLED